MGLKPRKPPSYDTDLVDRVRVAFGPRPDIVEQRMFGGLCFMVRGHMCVGVDKQRLMVRVGPERYADALSRPHARPMDFTGRPLTGFVFVDPAGIRTARAVAAWVARGLEFNASLPRK